MEGSPEVDKRRQRFGRKCPVCKARIVGSKAVLQRHVSRHSRLKQVQTLNSQVTPPDSPAKNAGFDVSLARDMFMSTPAKHRFTGGAFNTGPLAAKGLFEGMPEVFQRTGRFKKKLDWVRTGLNPQMGFFSKAQRQALGPVAAPNKTLMVKVGAKGDCQVK
ncbi:hypothetical protein FZEAL_3481 [Fusarium zealandicum]|uniref:Uncharacterized protein n=1 Tax=Fusarium zealandicum TaxID=1053134 RepID=A0A8H4XMK3_9HYPO|nr:hypothetical protein FZEAL_3481 [Fusarium zealandicum]